MLFGLGDRDRLGRTCWRLANEKFYGCILLFKLLETLSKRPR
jgi:hypothetical protein